MFSVSIIAIMEKMECKGSKIPQTIKKNTLNGTALVVWNTQGQIFQHIQNKAAFSTCYLATEATGF